MERFHFEYLNVFTPKKKRKGKSQERFFIGREKLIVRGFYLWRDEKILRRRNISIN